jgi:mannitol/fructose-specific phosphotransferase system IIA component (Ntr-type)
VKLHPILKPEHIKLNCTSDSTEEILKEMVHSLKLLGKISNEKLILKKLMDRERLGSTSIGNHSAVPHTKLKDIKEPIIFVGTSKEGVQYHEEDKEPVHLIILILSPNSSPIIHLQILAAAASLIKKNNQFIKNMISASSPEELIQLIHKYEANDD